MENRAEAIVRVRIFEGVEVPGYTIVNTRSVDEAQNACRNRLSNNHCLRTKARCEGVRHCPISEFKYDSPSSEDE